MTSLQKNCCARNTWRMTSTQGARRDEAVSRVQDRRLQGPAQMGRTELVAHCRPPQGPMPHHAATRGGGDDASEQGDIPEIGQT